MAIEPSKARELTQEDSELVELSEQKIDDSIIQDMRYGPNYHSGEFKVNFTLGEKLSNPAQNELRELYQSAGWNIKNFSLVEGYSKSNSSYTYCIELRCKNQGGQQ